MKYQNLFKPIKIRDLELKNRVVFPAMATNLIADGGYVTDKLIDYHVARAEGGNGLNITEAASVHAPSAPRNFLNISDDKFVPGLKKFTDAIHAAGGKACIQLWQGGIVVAGGRPECNDHSTQRYASGGACYSRRVQRGYKGCGQGFR
jgi:2,4-dienoyl-CoA reductase-like NADH-dependent reductase (Old Yellow Enzyme family)